MKLETNSLAYKEKVELEGTACSLCLIPGGKCLVLLKKVERHRNYEVNFEICKLDKSYSPIPYGAIIDLEDRQIEMCYIDDNRVVCTNGHTLVFIDAVSLKILSKKEDKACLSQCLVCYDGIIYSFDGIKVCIYDRYGTQTGVLCILVDMNTYDEVVVPHCKLAVNDDGESIYCLLNTGDMYKIDRRNGSILSTHNLGQPKRTSLWQWLWPRKIKVNNADLGVPLCMCYLGGGEVVICDDKGQLLKVSDEGKCELSKPLPEERVLHSAWYDTTKSRLLVGYVRGLQIIEVQNC